jgi:uncharacterized protein (TIGR02246 family)
MSYRRWGLLTGLGVILAVVGLATAGALRPRAAVQIEGQVDEGKKARPKPVGQLKPEAVRAEEAAIRKANQAFSAAFNKGDLDALAGLWTDDAEYITETGKAHRGKQAIRALLKKSMTAHKDSKQEIKVHSIRLVKPDVALVEGTVTMTTKDGTTEHGRFSAVYSKHESKWLISSVRDLPTPEEDDKPNAYNRLKAITWMLGEWVDKDSKKTITLNCKWAPGQTFLLQEVVVMEDDGKELRMTHVIGWDPTHETVRGWLFDATGGFSEGVWTREGNSWAVESEGWFGDGQASAAKVRWQYVDENTMTWSSTNRQADEMPLPDLKVTFVRKAKAKGKDR